VEINITFAKKIKMASELKYLLIIVFSFLVNSEVFCSDVQLLSDEPVVTCIEDHSDTGETDFTDDDPAFSYYDMMLVKDDSQLSKSRLFTCFLLHYDSRESILNRTNYQLKKPAANHYIPSPDYYVYALGKIVV